ncbi:MAG: hypothetical protein JJLCMIEE_00086 [Acidimicrobiales bacterium]|nr:MAG: protein translocase subunit SecD [Actinomycetota bacterium]MBV6507049.1 hypothetical protein [Acidimicrobiales bacterium]RIK05642.1 MAG: protein translocase subunit SecD [Acidobacteriota bacterium]
MRARNLAPLFFILAVAIGLLVWNFIKGNEPQLGLDLQGGVSVVLQPVEDGEVVEDVDSDLIDQSIEIIRNRIDAFGVAEPEISSQGSTVLVQLPGIEDQEAALDLVGQTAELRFRPVISVGEPPKEGDDERIEELRAALGMPEGVTAQQVSAEEQQLMLEQSGTVPPGTVPPGTVPPGTTATTAPAETTATTGPPGGEGAAPAGPTRYRVAQGPDTTGTTATTTTDTTATGSTDTTGTTAPGGGTEPVETPEPLNQYGIDVYSEEFGELLSLETSQRELTPPEDDQAEATVILPELDADGNEVRRYELGPTELTGDALENAVPSLSPEGAWVVLPTFKEGAEGIDQFNEVASRCVARDPSCPTGALGIVLDGVVISAPNIQQPTYERDQIQITGDFTRESAESLALALRYGALPVELEPQQVQTVSATLGEGALRTGIIAGAVAILLVGAYMCVYYRLLGLVGMLSLVVSGLLLWSIICWLGATLTLAGVVGIVMSIGVSLDSNVVYYENIKDDIRNGRTLGSAVDRAFDSAFSTIVKADLASLIGAGLLYFLTVGPVRGFALYLGLMTILDLVASYFFMRPLAIALGQSKLGNRPQLFGIPRPQASEPVAAGGEA